MSNVKSQVVWSTIFSYLGVAIGFVSQAIFIPIVLTKEQNGLLGILISYIFIFAQLASLGFNSAGSKFFHLFNKEHNYKGYWYIGSIISIIGLLIGSAIYIGLKPILLADTNSTLLSQYYYWVLPLGLFLMVFNFFDHFIKNLMYTVFGSFLLQFLQRFIILLAVLVLYYFAITFDTFMYLWSLGFAIPAILMAIYAFNKSRFSFSQVKWSEVINDNRFVHYSFITVLTGFSTMLVMYIDKIMISIYINLEDTGIYHTASFFGSLMLLSMIAMNKASIPLVTKSLEEKDFTTLKVIYQKSCLTQLMLGVLIFLGVVINIDSVFSFLPDGYEKGKWVVIWLCLAKLVDIATGINGVIINYSSYYKYDAIMIVGLIILTIAFNWFFIPQYGIVGAAFATLLSTALYNITKTILVQVFFKIQPFTWMNFKVFSFGVLLLVCFILLPSWNDSLIHIILTVVYKSGILILLYLIGMYYLSASQELNSLINKSVQWIKK